MLQRRTTTSNANVNMSTEGSVCQQVGEMLYGIRNKSCFVAKYVIQKGREWFMQLGRTIDEIKTEVLEHSQSYHYQNSMRAAFFPAAVFLQPSVCNYNRLITDLGFMHLSRVFG
jgi:hypothetical protein